MGAFADYDAYQTEIRRLRGAHFQMSGNSSRSSRMIALWRFFTPSPAIPTSSAALTDGSDVALTGLPAVNTGRLTILGARVSSSSAGGGECIIVADILNHSGGLDSTLATEQTNNLPTAALTRYTSGDGVMAGIIINGVIGAAGTTVTVKYTNQAGTPNRISTETVIGGTGFREPASVLPIPLAAGDTGVRSVESVTLAGTTNGGGATSLGVVLFKPLAMLAANNGDLANAIDAVTSGGFTGALAQAEPGACISLLCVSRGAPVMAGTILLAEV